ncbi:MAG: fluoride efflux transporter CrcB [Candidatus Saganbacteria bacterium]|nr:fluoride efflux transporter CrcB [Candidatus Saganbacteria bacterium]
MLNLTLLALGGGFGSVLRYIIYTATHETFTHHFPWGTVTVNLLGSFFIGLAWGILGENNLSKPWRLMLFTGFFGGFTTFSAFALENVNLFSEGKTSLAIWNILASNIIGILLVFIGLYLGRLLITSR